MKVCNKCFVSKEQSEFNKRAASKDGFRSECRECQREQMRDYRKRNPGHDASYYEGNKDDISLRRKSHYLENQEKFRDKNAKYYEENKDIVSKANTRWAEANTDKMREYRRSYKERHRDRVIVSEHNREAVKRSLLKTLTETVLKETLEHFDNKCVICSKEYEHLDHFIPLSSKHGGTTKENIVPMCASCNTSKNGNNPFMWAKTLTYAKHTNFTKTIEYLAELNGLTVDEYREFVFWCFENKREAHEITDENRDSLALWTRTSSAV